jgi:hypothetical protein
MQFSDLWFGLKTSRVRVLMLPVFDCAGWELLEEIPEK